VRVLRERFCKKKIILQGKINYARIDFSLIFARKNLAKIKEK